MAEFKIICEPRGENPGRSTRSGEQGKNEGGIVVLLSGGFGRQEVSRVAFERKNSINPDVEFADQLKAEVDKAKASIDILNELIGSPGDLR